MLNLLLYRASTKEGSLQKNKQERDRDSWLGAYLQRADVSQHPGQLLQEVLADIQSAQTPQATHSDRQLLQLIAYRGKSHLVPCTLAKAALSTFIYWNIKLYL